MSIFPILSELAFKYDSKELEFTNQQKIVRDLQNTVMVKLKENLVKKYESLENLTNKNKTFLNMQIPKRLPDDNTIEISIKEKIELFRNRLASKLEEKKKKIIEIKLIRFKTFIQFQRSVKLSLQEVLLESFEDENTQNLPHKLCPLFIQAKEIQMQRYNEKKFIINLKKDKKEVKIISEEMQKDESRLERSLNNWLIGNDARSFVENYRPPIDDLNNSGRFVTNKIYKIPEKSNFLIKIRNKKRRNSYRPYNSSFYTSPIF